MTENTQKLVETSYRLITIAKEMLESCQIKRGKVYSHIRYIISFFFRRALEMFESFLILIKENRIIDCTLLLRSILDMGMSLGYIFANDINEHENEIRARIYMLDGIRMQRKLINCNLEGFKEFNSNIEARRDELTGQIEEIESDLKDNYSVEKCDLPDILNRALISKSQVLKDAYNQSYRDLCTIEHHNMLFGQHYVDTKKVEPKEIINHLEHYSQLNPSVSIILFRIVFIEILNAFNQVFQLNWKEKIKEIRNMQGEDWALIKD